MPLSGTFTGQNGWGATLQRISTLAVVPVWGLVGWFVVAEVTDSRTKDEKLTQALAQTANTLSAIEVRVMGNAKALDLFRPIVEKVPVQQANIQNIQQRIVNIEKRLNGYTK